jgi:hypothetical protein
MANPFLFQSFLNTVKGGGFSSPNLYETPQGYLPQNNTQLTPQGLNKALNFLQEQTGKKITIIPDKTSADDSGYFNPELKGGGLFNSPNETNQRSIFMGPGGSYHTLFHETGHARDPGLRQLMAKEKQFNPQKIMSLKSAPERLDYFAQSQIYPRVQAETEAQAYTAFQLPRFAAANPDLNINTSKTFNDPWFKEYPASYAQQGIDKFFAAETGAQFTPVNFPTDVAGPGVAMQIFQPNVSTNALKLALDEGFQNKQKEVLDTSLSTVEKRLNPYQTFITPLRK